MKNIDFLVSLMDRLNGLIGFLYNFQLFERSLPEIRRAVIDKKDINEASTIIRSKLLQKPVTDEERSKLLSLYLNTVISVGDIVSSNLFGPKNINSYIFRLSQLIENAPKYDYRPDQIESLKQDRDLEVATKSSLENIHRDFTVQIQTLLDIEKTNSEI